MSKTVHSRAKDKFALSGALQLVCRNLKTGRKYTRTVFNTITYDGSNSPLFLWAPDGITVADWAMNELRFGTAGTPPTRGDTSLVSPLGGGPTGGIISIANPSNRQRSEATGEVIITGTLDVNHANGSTLTEIGIFFANGRLGMRQVFPGIPKNDAITVSATWKIGCTA